MKSGTGIRRRDWIQQRGTPEMIAALAERDRDARTECERLERARRIREAVRFHNLVEAWFWVTAVTFAAVIIWLILSGGGR